LKQQQQQQQQRGAKFPMKMTHTTTFQLPAAFQQFDATNMKDDPSSHTAFGFMKKNSPPH
jgi:hypothetical protein